MNAFAVLPRPAHPDTRTALRASQRGRLICAVADEVAASGYPGASIGAICESAGVSRKTFYEHFPDKEGCFLAAYDAGAASIHDAMVAAVDGSATPEHLVDSVLTTWLEVLDADHAFTRAFMIEFWAAGDEARERWKARRDRTAALLAAFHEHAAARDPAIAAASETEIAAVVGGVNRVVVSHLLADDPGPLAALKPDLMRFIRKVLATHEDPE